MYETIHVTCHGAGHIKRNEPCEDYSISVDGESCKIFVVSDGHGDSNCPRSRLGSEYACRISAEALGTFAESIRQEGWEDRLFDPVYTEKLVHQLITSIIGKWKVTVCKDYENNPLTDEERAGCDRYLERYDRGERIEHIYGATLIAGLLTDKYLLLLHQGDGRCVVFDRNGNVSQPVPWDDRCFANVCTSLCNEDAVPSCRYHIINVEENPVLACLLGSDGVEDSFSNMELMHSYYRELLIYAAEHSVAELHDHLVASLPDFSAQGSTDDVSIAGVIDVERIGAFVSRFETENAIAEKNGELRYVNERITSMEGGKMQFLEKRLETARQEYQKMPSEEKQQKCDAAQEELDAYRERYESFLATREGILKEVEAMRARVASGETEQSKSEETEQPEVDEERSKEETVKPEAKDEQPAKETEQPEVEVEQSEAEIEQPELETEQLEAETEQSEAETEQPEEEAEQPEAGGE